MASLEPEQIVHQRYQLHYRLGQYGARQTWLATDTSTPEARWVVLKLCILTGGSRWDELQLFERESQVLQQLQHPRIPSFIDAFQLDDLAADSAGIGYGLVYSYIQGQSLKQFLNAGKRFRISQIKQMARSLLEILIYLHELSPPVLHRDIKPSNVIWGKDGQLYLIDFGGAQDRVAMEGKTFTVVGTYGYTPMEQYGGRAVPASDLYALGATLIHLLTGVAPMDLPHTVEGLQFRDRISGDRSFINWVTKLAHPLLEKRFTSAREALDQLEHGLVPSTTDPNPAGCVLLARPYGSRIHLRTTPHSLQIDIPPLEASEGQMATRIVAGTFFVLLLLLLTLVFLLTALSTQDNAIFWTFTFVFCIPSIWGLYKSGSHFEPLRSLTITSDRHTLHTVYCFCHIPYWQYTRKLGRLKKVLCSLRTVRLESDRGTFNLAKGVGLSPEEIRWLAQEIDRWVRRYPPNQ